MSPPESTGLTQWSRRGSFRSLAELVKRINQYIVHWNEDAQSFEWRVSAAEILEKVTNARS